MVRAPAPTTWPMLPGFSPPTAQIGRFRRCFKALMKSRPRPGSPVLQPVSKIWPARIQSAPCFLQAVNRDADLEIGQARIRSQSQKKIHWQLQGPGLYGHGRLQTGIDDQLAIVTLRRFGQFLGQGQQVFMRQILFPQHHEVRSGGQNFFRHDRQGFRADMAVGDQAEIKAGHDH